MIRMTRIWAGTAIGLLTASAPLAAAPLVGNLAALPARADALPLVLAQADGCPRDQPRKDCVNAAPQSDTSGAHREHQQQPKPRAEAPKPAPQAQKPKPAPQAEPAPKLQENAAPAETGQKPRKARRDNAGEQAPAVQAAPAKPQPSPSAKDNGAQFFKKKQPEATAPAATEQPATPKREKRKDQGGKAGQPAQTDNGGQQAAPAGLNAGTNGATAPSDQGNADRRKKHQRDKSNVQPQPGDTTAPAANGQNQQVQPGDNGQTFFPNGQNKDRKHRNGNKDIGQQPGGQPGQTQPGQPAKDQGGQAVQGGDNGQAPIFDSQKRDRKHRRDNQGQQAGDQPPANQGPPPKDDRAAQRDIQPGTIQPITREKGRRIKDDPYGDLRDRHRPRGADVLKQIGDRLIIQFNNQTMVQSDEGQRLRRGAQDVYYDDLGGSRTRETIVRRDGSQIVTIRDADGNIVQRSRVMPDGREYVLSYVDESRYQGDVDNWRDPGDDLPPIRRVPRDQYILDSEQAGSPDDYYDFLEKPPVERITRLYSIGDVRRSARIRDIAPRIDLDTLNFDFGSATISQGEGGKLQDVAEAMQKLLDRNPAETFLIEGHTDAVGSPNANLALSDQRAEAVADVLTRMFSIPPENLVTQGYGEEFLKVDTQGPERANRRVAIRRITPLIAPVASDQ